MQNNAATNESGRGGNTLQIETLHLHISNSNAWDAAAARVWRSLVGADGSSMNQQWFEFDLTLYNIFSQATWRRWYNDKKLWSEQSLATEYTWLSRSWRRHSATDPHTSDKYSRIRKASGISNEVTYVSTTEVWISTHRLFCELHRVCVSTVYAVTYFLFFKEKDIYKGKSWRKMIVPKCRIFLSKIV